VVALLQDIKETLQEMKRVYEKQRLNKVRLIQKFDAVDLEAKAAKMTLYQREIDELQSREHSGNPFAPIEPYDLMQMKGSTSYTDLLKSEDYEVTHKTELSDSELHAKQRWQAEMQYQDMMAEKIGANVDELRVRAVGMRDVSATTGIGQT
jgi:hypothetical protein